MPTTSFAAMMPRYYDAAADLSRHLRYRRRLVAAATVISRHCSLMPYVTDARHAVAMRAMRRLSLFFRHTLTTLRCSLRLFL